jgi:5-hydroxyisourate hydrolase-like protein (transthyretin family)
MAACYAARYFGNLALEDTIDDYQAVKVKQQKINEMLADLMGKVQCQNIQMGMTQNDFYWLNCHEEIHYDNVYFNVCQVQGQISYWDDGKPADNLKVWISDENGAVIAEFVTDKAGKFDISFPVEDVSIFDEGELKKQITFHIEEWWYPEILETVEIPIFRKCKVDGLWAGRKEETINCYLEDVNEENGQVILNVRRIEMDADRDQMVNLEMPLFFTEGSYQTYILRSGQYKLGDTVERVVLEDGMTLETIFSLMYPDGTWAGEFMQIFAGATSSSNQAMDAMMNSDMHEADEIYRYIEQYIAINGDYPTYEITKVNSQIDTIEPIMIQIAK